MNKILLKIKSLPPLILSLISGALLIAGWPPLLTAFILFFAFVPMLLAEQKIREEGKGVMKFWLISLPGLFLWNVGTTWWVWFASPSGAVAMLIFNTLLMSIPLVVFSLTKRVLPAIGNWTLVAFWLSFEYFHFNWDGSWPWLTLGKGFSAFPSLMQWYEITGEMGGSIWILAINLMIVASVKWPKIVLTFALPCILSLCFLFMRDFSPESDGINAIVVQPNIDAYTEKFDDGISSTYIDPEHQAAIMVDIVNASPKKSLLVICPETSITGMEDEQDIQNRRKFTMIKNLVSIGKASSVLAGAETYSVYPRGKKPTYTANLIQGETDYWYDSYNTALLIDSTDITQFYHKSKLVPGTEKMPFASLGVFEKLSIELGGTSGSLGVSDSVVNFRLPDKTLIAPVVCYESIYGDYCADYVRNGAQYFAIITNDGWWGNTPGHIQHLQYGAIRAIETRRWIARSANTGVSCFIDPKGKIITPLGWDKKGGIEHAIYPLSAITFYVKYGNLAGGLSCIFAISLLLALIIRLLNKRSRKATNAG